MWKRSLAGLLAVLVGTGVLAAELTDDEMAVWDLEIAYWQYVKANDIPGYRSLWDEGFVGWPGFSEMPLGKAKIHEWVTGLHNYPGTGVEYDLEMGSVRAYGDVVAAHYLVRYSVRSETTGEIVVDEVVSRVTHTWQRQGDTWRIVTGMSGTWVGEPDD
jgi:ketosteroid isomerase-like protein